MTGASAILAGMDGWLNRSISNLEYIPNSLWKSLARHTFKPAGIVIDINSIMTAEGEKERFKAYYGVFLSNFGAIGGGLIGGAMGGIVGAAGGSALGNLGGNQLAEFSSDFVLFPDSRSGRSAPLAFFLTGWFLLLLHNLHHKTPRPVPGSRPGPFPGTGIPPGPPRSDGWYRAPLCGCNGFWHPRP